MKEARPDSLAKVRTGRQVRFPKEGNLSLPR
jgi:hypothetical protein